MAKLHGKYCMRAATDEEVAGRPGAALIASHWNFDDSIDALRQAVDGVDGGEPSKAGKAVGAGGEEDFDAWESKGSDVEMEDFEADAAGLRYRHRPDHPAYAGSDDRELGGRPSSDLEGGIPSPLRENGEERAAWAAGMRKSESGEYEVSEDSVLEIIAKKADEEVQVQGGGDLTGGASSSDGPPIGSQVGVQERLAARRRSSAPPGSVVEQFANRHMAQAGEAIAEADQETDSEDEEGGREGGGSAGTQAAPAPTRKPAPSPPPPPKRQPVLPPPPASPPAAIAQQAKRNRRRRSTINLLQTSMLPHEMLPGPPSEPPPSGGPTLPPPPVPQLAIGSEAKPGASASSSVRADTTPAAGQSQGTVPPPPPQAHRNSRPPAQPWFRQVERRGVQAMQRQQQYPSCRQPAHLALPSRAWHPCASRPRLRQPQRRRSNPGECRHSRCRPSRSSSLRSPSSVRLRAWLPLATGGAEAPAAVGPRSRT